MKRKMILFILIWKWWTKTHTQGPLAITIHPYTRTDTIMRVRLSMWPILCSWGEGFRRVVPTPVDSFTAFSVTTTFTAFSVNTTWTTVRGAENVTTSFTIYYACWARVMFINQQPEIGFPWPGLTMMIRFPSKKQKALKDFFSCKYNKPLPFLSLL